MSSNNQIFIDNAEYFLTRYGVNKTGNNNMDQLRDVLIYWITNKKQGNENLEVNENVQMFIIMMSNIDIRNQPIVWNQIENC